jgi:hypothetical protein
MGEFPNKATQFKKGSARAVEAGRKGGIALRGNPNVRRSARIRELKKKGMRNKNARWMAKILEDSEFMDIELVDIFNSIRQQKRNVDDESLMDYALKLKKAIHGEPQNDGPKIQINIMQSGDVENTIKRLLNEDKTITIGDDSAEVQGSE